MSSRSEIGNDKSRDVFKKRTRHNSGENGKEDIIHTSYIKLR